MIITNQSVELLKHDKHPYEFIEQVARTCYKSEDKITPGSAVKMVQGLVKSKHLAMIEHEYLYYWLDQGEMERFVSDNDPEDLRYINVTPRYVSGSFRAFYELFHTAYYLPINVMMKFLAQIKYPEVFGESAHIKYPEVFGDTGRGDISEILPFVSLVDREEILDCCMEEDIMKLIPHTFKFITNRGISHELVRHRPIAAAMESQRYVDYGQDKRGNQITVIHPHIHETDIDNYNNWHYCMLMCETQYMNLRKSGIPAEIARGVLPNDCKTEIVITATEEEWQHIVNLRYHGTTGRPHPQMYELMSMAFPVLQEESNKRIM